jgi:hypothetical protein
MSTVIAHNGVMAGSHTLLVFLPLLFLGAGLAFIIRAVTDKTGAPRPEESAVRLPDLTQRPLYHLHQQIRASAARPPRPARPEDGSGPGQRQRSRSGQRLVVHQ